MKPQSIGNKTNSVNQQTPPIPTGDTKGAETHLSRNTKQKKDQFPKLAESTAKRGLQVQQHIPPPKNATQLAQITLPIGMNNNNMDQATMQNMRGYNGMMMGNDLKRAAMQKNMYVCLLIACHILSPVEDV